MDILSVDFNRDDDVIRQIKTAKNRISSRINDYDGIKKDLTKISGSDNITTANTYIRKKVDALQTKYDQLDAFQTRVRTFDSHAVETDKRVANRINTETNAFYKREHMPNGLLYTLGCMAGASVKWLQKVTQIGINFIVDKAKSAWATIKQFYEDHKYLIDVIVDALLVVAAVVAVIASGGGAAMVFAAWGFAKATTDLLCDSAALGAHVAGDDAAAEEWSKKGLKDVMKEIIPGGEYLYYGMEIASAVFDITQIAKSAKTFFTASKGLKGFRGQEFAYKGIGIKSFKEVNEAGNIVLKSPFKITETVLGNMKFVISTTYEPLLHAPSEGKPTGETFLKGFKAIGAGYKIGQNLQYVPKILGEIERWTWLPRTLPSITIHCTCGGGAA